MHVHKTSISLKVYPVEQKESDGEEIGEKGDGKAQAERRVRNLGFFLWTETHHRKTVNWAMV